MWNLSKGDMIYNSWLKLFWKYWVKRVSVDMIVKDVWIAKGTFYLYYKNKEELYENIIDDILACWKQFMENLASKVDDVKERFYMHMVWSLGFFEKNKIVKNLIEWNPDYYIGKIDDDYLSTNHVKFMEILLWEEFSDKEYVHFIANTKWFFASIINHKSCFKTNEEYQDFVLNFAAVIVNGLFSDYKEIRKWRSFDNLTCFIPKIKK